jgi:NTP pyrophosphatase (non-canonical NTP hydrolase)
MNEFHSKVYAWARDRGIIDKSNSTAQFLKLMEEVGELAESLNRGKNPIDDIGDCLVVLANIASLEGLTLQECADHAWNEIENREGRITPEGIFVKGE